MANRDLTQSEIELLDRLKSNNSVRLFKVSALLTTLSAFCIATLSAERIPALVNLGLSILVLVVFLCALFSTKYRSNPLQKELKRLYGECKDNDSARKHLDGVNDWIGFGKRKREMWFPILAHEAKWTCTVLKN